MERPYQMHESEKTARAEWCTKYIAFHEKLGEGI